MPMIQFLPWCALEEACDVGEITLLPFDREDGLFGCHSAEAQTAVRRILSAYRSVDRSPVAEATVIAYRGKDILAHLEDDEMGQTATCLQVATFCALARRDYFEHLGYCNADAFALERHRFEGEPSSLWHHLRRRDGYTWRGEDLDDVSIAMPPAASCSGRVAIDTSLAERLISFLSTATVRTRARWLDAINQFNRSNTDSPSMPEEVEVGLLRGAIEQVLGVAFESNTRIATAFADVLAPTEPIRAGDSRRDLPLREEDAAHGLRRYWALDFCQLRDRFLHGHWRDTGDAVWGVKEHLFLASVAFPLLVKRLLVDDGDYQLTGEDHLRIDAFEAVADSAFFEPVGSDTRPARWPWHQLRAEVGKQHRLRRMQECLRSLIDVSDEE